MGFFLTGMGLAQNNSCECDPSALGNLASKVVSLENSVVQLQNDTEGQRGSISTLNTEVANLKSTTERQVSDINSEIATLKSTDSGIRNEVNNLKQTSVKARVVG